MAFASLHVRKWFMWSLHITCSIYSLFPFFLAFCVFMLRLEQASETWIQVCECKKKKKPVTFVLENLCLINLLLNVCARKMNIVPVVCTVHSWLMVYCFDWPNLVRPFPESWPLIKSVGVNPLKSNLIILSFHLFLPGNATMELGWLLRRKIKRQRLRLSQCCPWLHLHSLAVVTRAIMSERFK